MITNDAHSNEYAAAVAGMAETYGKPQQEHAVGDFVSGLTAGRRWSGYVQFIDRGWMFVDVDGGAWLAVPVRDITH
jgi:hypothetical protein